jgi:hypothetical protein
MNSKTLGRFVSAIGFAALALPGLAAQPMTVDFSGETMSGLSRKTTLCPSSAFGESRTTMEKSARRRWAAVEGRAVIGNRR